LDPRKLACVLLASSMIVPATAALEPALAEDPDDGGEPTLFQVGASSRDITPETAQFLGGSWVGRETAEVDAPLKVRAMAVGNGDTGVLFAEVDSQGIFAGYQQGPYGTVAMREAVAERTGVPAENVVVASSHTHAAPTLMGIWGPTDTDYLRHVFDQTVDALVDAWQTREAAHLHVSETDSSDLIGTHLQSSNRMPGWPADGDLSVIRAVSPEGHDVATFLNFGVHPDIVTGMKMSPDWLGEARAFLDERLDTTTVAAVGTLGRQETALDSYYDDSYQQIDRYGRLIASRALRTMDEAQPVTTDTLDGAMQYVSFPLTNGALAALLAEEATGVEEPTRSTIGYHGIDRAVTPPYMIGDNLGTWTGVLRIGDQLVFSQPGEAFPEVTHAFRDNLQDCSSDFVLGMAQDQLGYYWPAWETPFAAPIGDFAIFNVNPALGDIVARHALLAAEEVGCSTTPYAVSSTPSNTFTLTDDYPFAVKDLAFPEVTTPGEPVLFEALYSDRNGEYENFTWSLGDGTAAYEDRFSHIYDDPGTYGAQVTARSAENETASWTVDVQVLPAPAVAIDATSVDERTVQLEASLTGGSGTILQATWALGDGSAAAGSTVTHTYDQQGTYTVTVDVTDTSGLTASAERTVTVG
jgi:hypothetical protein